MLRTAEGTRPQRHFLRLGSTYVWDIATPTPRSTWAAPSSHSVHHLVPARISRTNPTGSRIRDESCTRRGELALPDDNIGFIIPRNFDDLPRCVRKSILTHKRPVQCKTDSHSLLFWNSRRVLTGGQRSQSNDARQADDSHGSPPVIGGGTVRVHQSSQVRVRRIERNAGSGRSGLDDVLNVFCRWRNTWFRFYISYNLQSKSLNKVDPVLMVGDNFCSS